MENLNIYITSILKRRLQCFLLCIICLIFTFQSAFAIDITDTDKTTSADLVDTNPVNFDGITTGGNLVVNSDRILSEVTTYTSALGNTNITSTYTLTSNL